MYIADIDKYLISEQGRYIMTVFIVNAGLGLFMMRASIIFTRFLQLEVILYVDRKAQFYFFFFFLLETRIFASSKSGVIVIL